MKDISAKNETYREAKASAFVTMPREAQVLLRERRLEKGDALEIARMAGIVAAKRTPELIPFCHGILITQAEVGYRFDDDGVEVLATVRTIASTGVEMEALTAASIAALTLYDMLKPHTTELAIRDVRLSSKEGGKSDYRDELVPPATVALVACGGKRGALDLLANLIGEEANANIVETLVSIGSREALRNEVRRLVGQGVEVVLTVGGTGVVHDDFAVEALRPLVDRDMPGVMEAARAYGQRRTPYSMLSRGISGMSEGTMIVTFPGSTRGVKETYAAVFPGILHIVTTRRRSEASRG